MLKNLIIISRDKQLQCENEQDVVRGVISKDYYQMLPKEKKEKLKMMAMATLVDRPDIQIVDEDTMKKGDDIDNKFVLLDEKSYVLSLLINSNIMLLESIDSNVYTNGLDKSQFTKKYIIVNNFAKDLLKDYVANYYRRKNVEADLDRR